MQVDKDGKLVNADKMLSGSRTEAKGASKAWKDGCTVVEGGKPAGTVAARAEATAAEKAAKLETENAKLKAELAKAKRAPGGK